MENLKLFLLILWISSYDVGKGKYRTKVDEGMNFIIFRNKKLWKNVYFNINLINIYFECKSGFNIFTLNYDL